MLTAIRRSGPRFGALLAAVFGALLAALRSSDYAVKRVLGEGAFARALLVANRKTGRVRAHRALAKKNSPALCRTAR